MLRRRNNQPGQRQSRGVLLRQLLGCALGLGQRLPLAIALRHAHRDAETLAVVRAALVGQDILRLACADCLQPLLQRGLVVADRAGERTAPIQRARQLRLGRLYDMPHDEVTRRRQPAIQIHRRDDRLQRVRQQCRLLLPAGVLLPAAHAQHRPQLDAHSHLREVPAAHQRCAQPRQLALARAGKTPIQRFRHQQPKHRIADVLQPLIVRTRIGHPLRIALIRQRAVRQRQRDQLRVLELVVKEAVAGEIAPLRT